MNQDEDADALIFGNHRHSASFARDIAASVDGYSYDFVRLPDFEALLLRDPAQGMKVYWEEMLMRAHWAASGSVIRVAAWMDGLRASHELKRVLPFAACMRGLLEAAADTNFSLNQVPITLAQGYKQIRKSLEGNQSMFWMSAELEELLIHFTHATKLVPKSGLPLPQHEAKTTADYLAYFKDGNPELGQVYRLLCDMVHPGSSSLWWFLDGVDEGMSVVVAQGHEWPELQFLRDLCRGQMDTIFIGAVTLPVLTLKTLNMFPLARVRTPAVDKINMDALKAWQAVSELIAKHP